MCAQVGPALAQTLDKSLKDLHYYLDRTSVSTNNWSLSPFKKGFKDIYHATISSISSRLWSFAMGYLTLHHVKTHIDRAFCCF